MSIAVQPELNDFIGYFEEPEPGVPDGHSGWYHSRGKLVVESAAQVFAINGERCRGLVRPDMAGPFHSKQSAIEDLMVCLEG